MKKTGIIILSLLVICSLVILAYFLGYKKSEADFKQKKQFMDNHIKEMFDISKLSEEEKKELEKMKLDIEEDTKNFLDLMGADVN